MDNGSSSKLENYADGETLTDGLNFTAQKVRKAISSLKNKKSRTPDGVPAHFLKTVGDQVCYPLSLIFEQSFASGVLPDVWKVADVVALFKKGEASDPGNYRPISLTSIACKIMEICLKDEIVGYLRQNGLLSDQQHGFLSRRSTSTQLLECVEDWTKNAENRTPTDVIYVDFKKAFDSVSHEKLLAKLAAYGIGGKLHAWIKAFLSDRKQRVCLGKAESDYVTVTSGVPQGSVLGPLLFVIFVNDLPGIFKDGVTCKLFADDLKIYCSSLNFENLQNALNQLSKWAERWQLGISVPKCNVLYLGDNNPKHEYFLDGKKLPSEKCLRDLGVFVSSDLKQASHCFEVAKKANRVSNMLFRIFRSKSRDTLLTAYKTFVRPLVEYCTPIWNPHMIKDIILVEKVQRYYTRRLFARCGFDYVSYPDRLKFLDLQTLEERRLQYDLCMVYHIVHNENDLKFEQFFAKVPGQKPTTRGHHLKLKVPKVTAKVPEVRFNTFSQRVVKSWNALPKFLLETKQPIVNASNIDLFKERISKL